MLETKMVNIPHDPLHLLDCRTLKCRVVSILKHIEKLSLEDVGCSRSVWSNYFTLVMHRVKHAEWEM